MKLITTRTRILDVVGNYAANYPGDRTFPDGRHSQDILAALKALDLHTCSAQDVEALVGNPSWTTLRCDECQRSVPAVVVMSESDNYEDGAVLQVCTACLAEALALSKTGEATAAGVPPEVQATVARFVTAVNGGTPVECPALPGGHHWLIPGQARTLGYRVFHLSFPEDGWLPGGFHVGVPVDAVQCSTLYCAPAVYQEPLGAPRG